MSKRFGINGEIIYCVNDDGSVTNVAIIDLEGGDMKPVENKAWYSELDEEIEILKKVQDNHSKLLCLVTDTNKQIITTKSAVTELVRNTNKRLLNSISQIKNIGVICIGCIALFLGVSVFTVIGDFFPNVVHISWILIIKIVHVVLVLFAVISVILLIVMYIRQSLLADKIQSVKNSSELLSPIHCNENEVYDFVSIFIANDYH